MHCSRLRHGDSLHLSHLHRRPQEAQEAQEAHKDQEEDPKVDISVLPEEQEADPQVDRRQEMFLTAATLALPVEQEADPRTTRRWWIWRACWRRRRTAARATRNINVGGLHQRCSLGTTQVGDQH